MKGKCAWCLNELIIDEHFCNDNCEEAYSKSFELVKPENNYEKIMGYPIKITAGKKSFKFYHEEICSECGHSEKLVWMTSVLFMNRLLKRECKFVYADLFDIKMGRPRGVIETRPRKKRRKKTTK